MRNVEKDLVEIGFMVKLEDIYLDKRYMIKNVPFQHYNFIRLALRILHM